MSSETAVASGASGLPVQAFAGRDPSRAFGSQRATSQGVDFGIVPASRLSWEDETPSLGDYAASGTARARRSARRAPSENERPANTTAATTVVRPAR